MKGPKPAEVLEELADKVIAQIPRLAVTSFEGALEEMTDFHLFLLRAYETRDVSGNVQSFAQMGFWGAQHRDWMRQYRRVFDRAIEAMDREEEFIKSLVREIPRLIQQRTAEETPETIEALLDLANILVHRLEEWVSRRVRTSPENDRQALVGYDKALYESVLNSFVGAWEDACRAIDIVYRWSDANKLAEDKEWSRYTSAWPMLRSHLYNTAYLLAVAIRDRDAVGVHFYGDALKSWLKNLGHQLNEDHLLRTDLLTPAVLSESPSTMKASLTPSVMGLDVDAVSLLSVFSALLRLTYADALLAVAGVLTDWAVQQRGNGDDAIVASRIATDAAVKAYSLDQSTKVDSFRHLFFGILRLLSLGPRFARQTYATEIDKFIGRLDGIQEHAVIPGRIYSPSTKHDREGLASPLLITLAREMPNALSDKEVQRAIGFLEHVPQGASGDDTRRRFAQELEFLQRMLDAENLDYLVLGLQTLGDEQEGRGLDRVRMLVDAAAGRVDAQITKELVDRPISLELIERKRREIEAAIHHSFDELAFGKVPVSNEQVAFEDYRVVHPLRKAWVVDPPMEDASNAWDVVIEGVQQHVRGAVWRSFLQLARRSEIVGSQDIFYSAIMTEAQRIGETGKKAVLLVPSQGETAWIDEWFGWRSPLPDGVVGRRANMPRSYIGSLGDVDVFRVRLKANCSFVVPSDHLKKVAFGTTAGGHVAQVECVAVGDGKQVTLTTRFSLQAEWADEPVLMLELP